MMIDQVQNQGMSANDPGLSDMEKVQTASTAIGRSVGEADRFVISVIDHCDRLPDDWPSMSDPKGAVCYPFQCRDLLAIWADTVGPARGAMLSCVVVREATGQRRPVLMLPLCIERRRGVRELRFMDGDVSDYNAPVLFAWTPQWDTAVFAAIWAEIVAALPAFDMAVLEKMPLTVLGRDNPLMTLKTSPWVCSCHSARLEASWAAFSAERISPPKRYQRYQRSLRRSHEIAYHPIGRDQGSDAVEAALEVLFRQKQRRFEETRVPGFEAGDGRKAFYTALTISPVTAGHVHLSVLNAGEEAVGSQWGIVFGDRYYYLICGNEGGAWAKYSTGRMVNEAMLEWCHDHGLAVADFGIGDEGYKFEFCDVHTPLASHVSAQTLPGRGAIAAGRLVAAVKSTKLYDKLRPYKWVLLRALRR